MNAFILGKEKSILGKQKATISKKLQYNCAWSVLS